MSPWPSLALPPPPLSGNLAEYWRLFRSHRSLIGGFIWDWVDQSLLATTTVEGQKVWEGEGDGGRECRGHWHACQLWGGFPSANHYTTDMHASRAAGGIRPGGGLGWSVSVAVDRHNHRG